jgi:hypothetical protein
MKDAAPDRDRGSSILKNPAGFANLWSGVFVYKMSAAETLVSSEKSWLPADEV